eukprot:CAMPEP_0114560166 /NCGR_PEP_ID=MMETSP0114-20121206/11316_1 /TAXON_ID=31324 /ORGANISM="Goniomonas sp, Strain m" /LENGTH=382 /DNA_ID=CAMNT_0001745697 /DNA_START=8 /DNA_END=1156 /DNA_ORIENTATION=-
MASSDYQMLEAQKTAHPEISDLYEQLKNYEQRKLWHQLTVTLEQLVNNPCFETGDDLLNLHAHFISKFDRWLNRTKLVQILLVISKQCSDPAAAIAFMTDNAEKVKDNAEAHTLANLEVARLHLESGDVEACKKIVEAAQEYLGRIAEVEPIVNSSFYQVNSLLHKFLGNAAEFYTNSLLYLAYTPVEDLAPAQCAGLAFDLGLAALCGEKIYQFGELLLHPILASLEGTPQEWLPHLLRAFNSGNIPEFEKIAAVNHEAMNAQPILRDNAQKLREKIRIFALMELIRDRPAHNRLISFVDVATRCTVTVDEVEILVMKALSLELVKGVIDQVDQTVRVTWVHPRVLDLPAIAKFNARLGDWISQVQQTLVFLDNETPEILA